jgi:hypothetical protein
MGYKLPFPVLMLFNSERKTSVGTLHILQPANLLGTGAPPVSLTRGSNRHTYIVDSADGPSYLIIGG